MRWTIVPGDLVRAQVGAVGRGTPYRHSFVSAHVDGGEATELVAGKLKERRAKADF